MGRKLRRIVVMSLVVFAMATGCSSDSSTSSDTTTKATSRTARSNGSKSSASTAAPTTSAPGGKLRILVTNDDGVAAAGIDAVVEGLRKLPDTEVTVVAPATNQSGTGGKTSRGRLQVNAAKTASGYDAKAVTGFPADTIVWAVDQNGVQERPHVVVSGINMGQNIGPLSDISGTVGAARAAARRGIPSLAASQGLAASIDYSSGVKLVTTWVSEHKAALLATTTPGSGSSAKPATVVSINVPSCVTGSLHTIVEVPTATDVGDRDISKSDCVTRSPAPKDDVDAFIHGYPSLSPLELTPA